MTSAYYFHLLDFTSELSILSNYAEHLKELAPYYTLPPFTKIKCKNKIIKNKKILLVLTL